VKATLSSLQTDQPEVMAMSPVQHHAFPPFSTRARVYRLTDGKGVPHAVLDECFESLDGALEAALEWIELQRLVEPDAGLSERHAALCLHFGVEVSTPSGDWRTLRHAGLTGCSAAPC
jgi:hypothetical protein